MEELKEDLKQKQQRLSSILEKQHDTGELISVLNSFAELHNEHPKKQAEKKSLIDELDELEVQMTDVENKKEENIKMQANVKQNIIKTEEGLNQHKESF